MGSPVLDKEASDMTQEELDERQKAIDRGDFVDGDDAGGDDAGADVDAGGDGADAGADAADDKPDAAALRAVADDEGQRVPLRRFREVNDALSTEREARARLEGELAALRGQQEPKKEEAPQPTARELRKKATQATLEGRDEEAAEFHEQADRLLVAEASRAAVSAASAVTARTELDRVAERVITAYPFLDSESEGANQAAIKEVIEMRDARIAAGHSPGDALAYAADKIGRFYKLQLDSAAASAKKDEPGDEPRQQRQQQALARGARAAAAQPATLMGGKGDRANSQQTEPMSEERIRKMTDAEFRALPESEKARLRGD